MRETFIDHLFDPAAWPPRDPGSTGPKSATCMATIIAGGRSYSVATSNETPSPVTRPALLYPYPPSGSSQAQSRAPSRCSPRLQVDTTEAYEITSPNDRRTSAGSGPGTVLDRLHEDLARIHNSGASRRQRSTWTAHWQRCDP